MILFPSGESARGIGDEPDLDLLGLGFLTVGVGEGGAVVGVASLG
jgi:hypothetical protein